MNYVISYDVTEDKIRLKISDELEAWGQRVQKSVFECKIPSDQITVLIENLNNILDGKGNIRIYPLCKECYEKGIGIGNIEKIIGGEGFEIF